MYQRPTTTRPQRRSSNGYLSATATPTRLTTRGPPAGTGLTAARRRAAGQMRSWSWQAVAHGADGVLSFQWRQSRGGGEKFHSGMVPHFGTQGRTFAEVRTLGAELAQVPELAGT